MSPVRTGIRLLLPFICVVLVVLCTSVLVGLFWPQRAVYDTRMRQYGDAMDTVGRLAGRYREMHEGRIPTVAEVLHDYPEEFMRFEWPEKEWVDRFQILKLPDCLIREGVSGDAYLVMAKMPPDRLVDWHLVWLGGRLVSLAE